MILRILFYGLLSLIISLILTPLVIRLAHKKGWIVLPREDRWHKTPTALMGGISIFLSFLITSIISSQYYEINWWILFSFTIMFFIGFIDDLREVKPIVKLLAQVFCAFILISNGFQFGNGQLQWFGIILTFFWVIGITNSINLLDNMDGLSAGITAIIALVSGIINIYTKDFNTAILSFIISGSTIGFIKYNFNPARIFMGDSGSLFLGFALSYFSLSIQKNSQTSSLFLTLLFPLTLMAIPIFDTTLVTFKRLISGRRIDHGGKDHSSHRLVAIGFTEKGAVIILYLITLMWSSVTLIIYMFNNISFIIPIVSILLIILAFFGLFLGYVKVYSDKEESFAYHRSRGDIESNDNIFIRFLLMNKKIFIGFIFDILAIYSAFVLSLIILRIDTVQKNYEILALIIIVKLTVFYFAKLYKRSWRYSSVLDFSIYFSSNIFSTILLLFFIQYFNIYRTNFNYDFFLIDFSICFILISFIRIVFKLIQETITYFKNPGTRIIIYGAGDLGYLLTKKLILDEYSFYKPVSFLDDDPEKQNIKINSIPVSGTICEAKIICNKFDANIILIASDKITDYKIDNIITNLKKEGIKVGRFTNRIDFF